ncbi:MAG TPA: NAD(P)-binding domain-containing protein [Acidimicrobiales bacterium]|nr:NAD(P)-binding domain-containing protein [Acidimicrobiales bacterium]
MEGTVGLVGAGAMGAGMWRRLQAQGVTATVFDVRPEAMDVLAREGAPVAESAGDVAAAADVVLISVPRSEHVLAATSGPAGIAARGRPGGQDPDIIEYVGDLERAAGVTIDAGGAG